MGTMSTLSHPWKAPPTSAPKIRPAKDRPAALAAGMRGQRAVPFQTGILAQLQGMQQLPKRDKLAGSRDSMQGRTKGHPLLFPQQIHCNGRGQGQLQTRHIPLRHIRGLAETLQAANL